ncbi:type II CAAX endopeptidase family protein [Virgibacillus sp. YIM 98842]|uniref:CPBP family intramembrane glutamic endopeptidase n=1 Tax=Virgibacillus sp. YIM 98842 TaxID=2663533 RepID=UPI0013D8E2D0|nr:type II CAAX endopeptidase family protein [Virgibacillus sp. YIM 98842]
MKQSEIIEQLSDEELKQQLFISQGLFIVLAFVLSFIFFDDLREWLQYFSWEPEQIFLYGVIPGLIIVLIDIMLVWTLPKRYYDDGGINERVFKGQQVSYVFILSLTVAFAEEILFRGVLQTTFGYIIASAIFALVHFRYLNKPVLFISILFVSFYIGYLFEVTGNLAVTITAHFIVDFLLGLFIRLQR